MPIRFSIDDDTRRMWTVATGLVSYQDIMEHLDAEEAAGGLGRRELFNTLGATTDLTAQQVRDLVQRARETAKTFRLGPTAIVSDNDVLYGMARMYSILCEDVAVVEVFRDLDQARIWLDEG